MLYFLQHASYFLLYLDDVMRVFKKIEGYTFWPGILVEEWRQSVQK